MLSGKIWAANMCSELLHTVTILNSTVVTEGTMTIPSKLKNGCSS